MKKVFISMPMGDKNKQQMKQEITEYSKQVEKYVRTEHNTECELIDSLIPDADKKSPIECLVESIKFILPADIFVACPGWRNARGCRIEHSIAKEYGKEILDLEEYGLPVFERKMLEKIKELSEQQNIKTVPSYGTDEKTVKGFKLVRKTPNVNSNTPPYITTEILVVEKLGENSLHTYIKPLNKEPSQNFNSVLWGVLEQKYENDNNKAKEQAEQRVLDYLDEFKQNVFPRGRGSK